MQNQIKLLMIAIMAFAFQVGAWAPIASALELSVSVDTADPIFAGETGIIVTIITDEEITVGSTDITFNWDTAGIWVTDVSSSVLSNFTFNIDNPSKTVLTASATGTEDVILADTALMTFEIQANLAGVYELSITDGDGTGPIDLAGPVPPVPPDSIPYTPIDDTLTIVCAELDDPCVFSSNCCGTNVCERVQGDFICIEPEGCGGKGKGC